MLDLKKINIFLLILILNLVYTFTSIRADELFISNITLRNFFESFNYNVIWDSNLKSITVKNDKLDILFDNENNYDKSYKFELIDNTAYISYETLNRVYLDNKDIIFKDINYENLPNCYKFNDIDKSKKLIIFGASWCNYCKEQLEELKISNEFEKLPFEILFISIDKDKEEAKKYFEKYNLNVIYDIEKVLFRPFDSKSIPTLVFIDNGKIIYIEKENMLLDEILNIFVY